MSTKNIEELEREVAAYAATAKEATLARDYAIAELFRAGAPMRKIGRLVGMTHGGITRILQRDGVTASAAGE